MGFYDTDKKEYHAVTKGLDIMRVLYFLDFPWNIGGSNKVMLTQAFIMKQRGYQVKVIIPDDSEGHHDSVYDDICTFYQLETETKCYSVYTCIETIDINMAFQECESILPLIVEYRPNLIHSVQLNIGVALAAEKLRIPHLMNIYQVDKQSFMLDWLKIYPQYHSADSLMMSERWKNGLEVPSRCIRVAYQQKEGKRDNFSQKDSDTMNIIAIGRVCEVKNHLEIIKFVQICRENKQNVKLKILGDCSSEYARQCKRYVYEHRLTEFVSFEGFVSNVKDYLQQADLFVLASVVESYPGVIVESMANGIPVLSTPVAGVPELLRDGENGFLADGCEAEDIYRTFLRYMKYRETGRISQIVDCAYSTYLDNHTYASVGEELERYYQWIIQDYTDDRARSCLTYRETKDKIEEFIDQNKITRTNQACMRHIWFLYHIYPALENKKIMIWGAGHFGSVALEWLKPLWEKIDFAGFIDSNKKGRYLGYPIMASRDDLILECDVVLVAVGDTGARLEIMGCLEKNGKQRNRDYFLVYNSPVRV